MPNNEKHATWGGRFSAQPDLLMQVFSESVSFDKRLASYDLNGSLGHAAMLAHVGLLSTKELKEMHPAKLMNYLMQSLETSNNIIILKEVLRYLKDKKTSIALYTYDAILFDFNKEDGKETLNDIENIMSLDNKFPVKFKFSSDLVL